MKATLYILAILLMWTGAREWRRHRSDNAAARRQHALDEVNR